MIGDLVQPTHLLLILIVALLVLGPKRLPEVGKSLGRGLRDFRDAVSNYSPDSLLQSDEPTVHAAEAGESELHREPPAAAAAAQGAPREASPPTPSDGESSPHSETTSDGASPPRSGTLPNGGTTPNGGAIASTASTSGNDTAEDPTAVHHPTEPAGSAPKAPHAPTAPTDAEPVDAEVVPDEHAGRASG